MEDNQDKRKTLTLSEQIEWRNKNDFWIIESQRISLKVLKHLRQNKLSRKDLAEKLEMKPQRVSKITSGSANMTLETICKLQRELGLKLISVPEPKTLDELGWFSDTIRLKVVYKDVHADMGESEKYEVDEKHPSMNYCLA